MGNSCGAMHKYTELTDREPRYQGGFIWDYIDQSIYKRTDTASGSSHMAEISATGLQMEISAETASATAERERLLQRCRRLSSIIRISRLILTATTSLQSQTKSFVNTSVFDAFAILLADGEEVYRTKLQISVPPMDRASYEVPVTLKIP